MGVATRPAADVEHLHARLQVQRVGEEGDLLLGAFRERVPQVGLVRACDASASNSRPVSFIAPMPSARPDVASRSTAQGPD